jgi:putative ABC transport system substrate-binding protein
MLDQMNPRRLFILCAGVPLIASKASAQPAAALRRIGVFMPAARGRDEELIEPFWDEMRKLGWSEGRTIAYDRVFGDDRMDTMPAQAAELVARRPEIIVAFGPTASNAVKHATSTIPIVFAVVVDPVAAGLVGSMARPGGNATGVAQSIVESLAPKRVQLLLEILPALRRLGILGNTLDPGSVADQAALTPLAAALGISMVVADATNPAQFEASVKDLVEQRVPAIVVANGIAVSRRAQMIEMANRARIPVVGFNAPMADAGALFSLGPSITNQIRRSAHLVDKLLRGAKPADIPVEASNVLELVVNQKSARALGITIPRSLLLQADRIIE